MACSTATGFSDAGRELRESIEVATDDQMAPALDALGDDVFELFAIMEPWGAAVRSGLGYLSDGPHDLAKRSTRCCRRTDPQRM